jgi:bifunctional UDP-N-acetylglucosamine pyrophosphorylase/glucosamine-1-phosphate N-acetyltransferase
MSTSTRSATQAAIVILAAGKGTRLKSQRPKVLHEIGGLPLLAHVIRAATAVAPAANIYCVVGHEAERVRQAVAHYEVSFVEQREQLGTGHALMQCRKALAGSNAVLVLSGDVPLISPATISRLRDFHLAQGAAMTILTTEPPDPFGYGRILRQADGEVSAIAEQKSLEPHQAEIKEINSGIYVFDVAKLFRYIDQIKTDNPHHEFYLTDIVAILRRAGERVLAVKADNASEVLGVNTRAELAALDAIVRARKAAQLMDAGVTIFQPASCVIDQDVQVGPDTVIGPFVQLLGSTCIGSECQISSFSVLTNMRVGDSVTIRHGSVLADSVVQNQAVLGPYCHIRPESHIGEGAHVGNFVEVKKARLGRGAKANHLSYIGDAEIGEKANIGAGTITCNYDGVHKHKTTIGNGAFIGSDTTLVAPVSVGDGAYVGAGSCITKDVPADALAIARGHQENRHDWAKARREKMKKSRD